MSDTPNSFRFGAYATCETCRKHKKPRGRSAPLEMANSLCDSDCPGYCQYPLPGDLWPGETAEEFGYPCQTTDDRNRGAS